MKELYTALIEARKAMPDPRKSGKNPAFKSSFVPRDEALDAIVPTALQYGLLVSQYPVSDEHGYGVHTTLIHTSGQSLDCGYFTVRPVKDDPQGAVAATTYASRCALMLVFAIAGDDDDDGNAVSGKGGKPANAPAKPQDAPQATQTTKVVHDTTNDKPTASTALQSVVALGKRLMAAGVTAKELADFAKESVGKATKDMTDAELIAFELMLVSKWGEKLA